MKPDSLERQGLELALMRDALREMAEALGRLASEYYKAASALRQTNSDKATPG